MNVAFFHCDARWPEQSRLMAEGLVASVLRVMPETQVHMLTDLETEPIAGVTHVKRMQAEPWALMRIHHQCLLKDCDWLFLDTDVIVQQDVSSVFNLDFDIAVTTRKWKHLKRAEGFSQNMPFNAGVIFSRSRRFWAECYHRMLQDKKMDCYFMGHQQVVNDVIASGKFNVAQVKGSKYNCPPYVEGGKEGGDPELGAKMLAGAAIVHYKGAKRKQLMLERIRTEGLCA